MAERKYSNNASTTLSAGLSAGVTTCSVVSNSGFPSVTTASGDWFMATIYELVGDVETNVEIVKVTNNPTTTWTIARAQESTTDRTYAGTTYVEHRLTAGDASSFNQRANNLSDVSSAATARTNLGLGTIATQAASAVAITGGTISGTDVTVGAAKTLDVSAGTLTLANDQISGDKVEGGTITAVTVTTLSGTTANETNVEVTNIKAKDGTAAVAIANTTGAVTVSTQLNVDNLRLDANSLTSTNTNGDITIDPNGSGVVNLDAVTARVGHTGVAATFTTNGAGDLTLSTNGGTNSGVISIVQGLDGAISITPNGNGRATVSNATLNNAVLGTPTSGTLTNCTGLPPSTGLSATVGETKGGTGQSTWALGDTLYSSATNTLAKLAGNTTTTKNFLSMTGTGAVGAAPVWSAVSKSDVGLSAVENTALSTWAGSANITTLGTISTGTWNATAIADGKIASALTGKTYNGLTLTAAATGFTVAGGTTSKTLTISNTLTFSGTDASTLNIGTGGTLGTAAYTASTAYAPAAGSASVTTLGTVTTGTWSATAIAADKGGTGNTSYTIGDLLYASGAAALSKLAGVATGNVLLSGGVGTAPAWGKVALTTHVSGILPVANGGTNNAFFTISGPTTSAKTYTVPDASCTILTSNAAVTVGQGGTGATTLTGVLKGNGTSAFTAATAGTDYVAPGTATTFTAQQTFKEVKDTVHTITDAAAFEIDPANGSIQVVTLGASRTPAATNFEAGQCVLLGIDDGTAYTVTWTTVAPTWVKPGGTGAAPTLATTGYTWVLLWKVGSVIYGAEVGKP